MKKVIIFFLLFFVGNSYSQSPTCAGAQPICSGNVAPFANTVGQPSFGTPGCLGPSPNPAWFYLQVGQSGNLEFTLNQGDNPPNYNNQDVDFIIWGPFTSPNCTDLFDYSPGATVNNIIDCSYSTAATESMTIPNAITGQYYMLVVTNYENDPGFIELNQTNLGQTGAGTTNCNIVCGVTLGPDRILCGAATNVTLVASFLQTPSTAGSPVYSWYLNGVFQYTTTTNSTTVNQNGTWSVSVTRPGCSDVATDDVVVNIIGVVPFNSIGPFSGPAGECNPTFDLLSYQNALVSPYDPAGFTFTYYDENGNVITDPANFSPTADTFIGIEISVGPCSSFDVVDFFVDCVPATCDLDLTSAAATDNQTICFNDPIVDITYAATGDATGINATGLPTGLTAVYNTGVLTISGTPTQTGTFNYSVETVGCTTNLTLTGTITINSNPSFTSLTANGPICVGANAVFTLSGTAGASVVYSINGNPVQFVILDASGNGTITITGAASDVSIVLSEIELGSCDTTLSNTATVIVSPTPAVPTIVTTAPTCLADGFSTISNYDATVTYTFNPAGPTVGAGGLISGMNFGTSYTVTAGNGTCTSVNSALFSNVATLSVPAIPTVSITAPTCLANGFATITNYNGALTYTFTPSGPTVGAGGLVSGMTMGTNYVVNAGNGSCSSADSASFSVASMLVTPAVPTIATTAPTCLADGFSTISNYDGTVTYTFNPAGPTVGAGGLISGMTLNTLYEVTASNATCTSVASAQFSNLPILVTPVTPTVSITAPTCLANGFATITNYNGTLTYTFNPAGPTVGAGGLVSGMTMGTNYVVNAGNGSCSSVDSASFSVASMLVTPAVPTIATTAPTCLADGFSTISNYDATVTYTFNPAGPTVGAGGLISGMILSTSYEVTSSNATCTSVASAQFSNLPILVTPVTPTVSITAPTCLANGFATITNYNGTLTYTFNPAGPTVGAGGLVSGMTMGTNYVVNAGNGSCSSVDSASFSVASMLVTPAVPTIVTTAPTCLADGFSTISNYDATVTYTFNPAGPSVGAGGLISGMILSTSYEVTSSNATCTSAASAQFSNLPILVTPVTPTVSITAPTCLANGFATITNYNGALTYTFTPSGPTVGAGGLVSGMTMGTNYVVNAGNGSCSSADSASFSVASMLVTPAVPTIATTAPTCLADGFSTISNYDATVTYTFNPAGPTVGAGGLISGMTLNTSYEVTASNATCTSVASAQFSNLPILVTPVTPTVSITAPTCLANGFATITNYNGTLTYTFNPAGPTVGAGGLVSGMTMGTNYVVNAGNGSCSSADSASFSVASMLVTPAVPTIATTAPTCLADGFSTISNYDATVTYTFNPAGPTVGAGGLISGMTLNTLYEVTSSNATCTSVASAQFSNAAGLVPVTPLFTQVSPICQGTVINLPTTSNNGISGSWSPVFNANSTATYTFTPSVGECATTTNMTVVVYPRPIVVATPLAQSFCSGGTTNIQLSSNVPGAVFSWTATATSITGQSSSTGTTATSINQTLTLNAGTNLPAQVTYVVVAEANGCASNPVTIVVTVNPIPDVIVSPTEATICSGATTNISFTSTYADVVFDWTVQSSTGVTGASNGSGNSIQQVLSTTGLLQGTVIYEVTPSLNGCVGNPEIVTIHVNPVPELFGSPNHPELCSGESTFISVSTFNPNTVFDWVVDVEGVDGASGGTATSSSMTIVQMLTTTSDVRGYVDYIITPRLDNCIGNPIVVRVYVNPLPKPTLTDGTICVDANGIVFQNYTLNSGLDNATYDFVWYFEGVAIPNSNNSTYTASAVGTYSVIATNSLTNCVSDIVSAVVTATNPATSFTYVQNEYFSDNATITINVIGGNGTLQYQLDEGALQSSNVFTNVSPGEHTITVIDTQGCTYFIQTIFVIDYPKYFTPNGDGINDTWNIVGLQDQLESVVYIYDRYGKLIKEVRPAEPGGWDGTYNQENLPSTDYWFTVDYLENGSKKQFKAHFSMKR